ncbi:hypothetical protein NX059_000956 [Plenodomus lindquistii]|nr:hypothetical protein NX059_000956 [Plenodomus lindquistii]
MAAEFSPAGTPIGKYFSAMAEMGVMRVYVEHGIFDAVPDEGVPLKELTAKAKVEFSLIERFANFLLAISMLVSPAPGYVAHTPASNAFTDQRVAQFYSYLFDFFMGPTTKWTGYFAANGLAEPGRSNRSPGGFAMGMPDRTAYEIMATIPGLATRLNGAMAVDGDISVIGVYDFGWLAAYAKSDASKGKKELIVEGYLGGNARDSCGEVCSARSAACNRRGTVGALVYYIRRVLNDWSDHEALQILKNVRAACINESRVLIAEYLRPEHPSVYTSTVDMFILNIGGKVRSEKAVGELAAKAGLKIVSVARHERTESAVVEMVPIETL